MEIDGKYIGYCEVLPIKRGDRVRIKKGTLLNSTRPGNKNYHAGSTYCVTVHHVLHGMESTNTTQDPEVCWTGSGGYWVYANINDVEKV